MLTGQAVSTSVKVWPSTLSTKAGDDWWTGGKAIKKQVLLNMGKTAGWKAMVE